MARLTEDPTVTTPRENASWKVMGDALTKIAVSEHTGKIWKGRRDQAQKKREELNITRCWDQAIKYYENDQLDHRIDSDGARPGNIGRDRITDVFSETENIVFANVVAAVPLLYAKNPGVEVTCDDPALDNMCTVSERLANALLMKKEPPGLNFKSKVRRAILNAFLTNLGWIEIGWIPKLPIDQPAMEDAASLVQQLEVAKDLKTINELEGKLQALEEKFNIYEEPGPFTKWHRSDSVLRDPSSVEEDLSDADWVMVRSFMKTQYLRAKYGTGKDDDKSLFEPTHLLPVSSGGDLKDEINNFTLLQNSGQTDYKSLGYPDEVTYNDCQITMVWTVWDKVSRRVYMFHDKNWKWPIWAYNDPYKLTTFFPVVPLSFYSGVRGGEAKGEVSYYLDQQDGINFVNSVRRQIMDFAALKMIYNPKATPTAVAQQLLNQNRKTAIPVELPEGVTRIADVMPQGVEHPAMKALQLFTIEPYLQAIDRIASVSDVMRGSQFKTNTTNEAVQFYQQAMQNRFDDLIDQIEDFIGQVSYLILQLCWKNWEKQDVAKILGISSANMWIPLLPEQINTMSVHVVGGSTMKPTGAAKKREALQIAQMLGQFAKATPMAGVMAIRVMSRAFDEIVMRQEDWDAIMASMGAANVGQPTPTQDLPNPQAGNGSGKPPYTGNGAAALTPEVVAQEI